MTAIALLRPRNALLDRLRTIQFGLSARGAVGVGLATQRAGAAAGGFSPLDVPGLALWIAFSDATKLYTDAGSTLVSADGDLIYQANDKSGNTRNAIQATSGSRPAYKTGIKNSLSVARFDGSNDALVSTFGATLNQPNTIIAVAFLANRNSNYHDLYDGIGSGNRHVFYQNASGDPDVFALYAGGNPQFNVTTNRWGVLSVIWNGASSAIYDNGSQVGGAVNVGTNTLTGLTIGNRYTINEGWNGDIAEVLIYNAALSSGDRGSVETYLNSKYAVY